MALAKGSFCRRREKNRHDLYFWTICGRKTGVCPGNFRLYGSRFFDKSRDVHWFWDSDVAKWIEAVAYLTAGHPEPELEKLAEQLGRKEVVIATETGCGVVPIDAAEREAREAAGRLSILLAKRAQKVIRVWCGLPESLR